MDQGPNPSYPLSLYPGTRETNQNTTPPANEDDRFLVSGLPCLKERRKPE